MTAPASPDVPAKKGPNYGRAVIGDELQYVSVTQIEAHDRCPKRYWYVYKGGLKEEKTKSLDFGIGMHERLAHYLRTGENVLGPVELPGMQYLPKPARPELLIETDIGNAPPLMLAGIRVVGAEDFVDLGLLTRGMIDIGDHKSSKDPEQWGKTSEQLATNTQGLIYAADAFQRWPEAKRASFRHITYATSGPRRALHSKTTFDVDTHEAKLLTIKQSVAQMRDVIRERSPEAVRGIVGPESCNAFRRPCPHAAYCNAKRDAKPAPLFGQRPEGAPVAGVFDRLRKAQSAITEGAERPQPPPSDRIVEVKPAPTVAETMNRGPHGFCTKCATPLDAEKACVKCAAPPVIAQGVVPPDAPQNEAIKKPEPSPEPVADAAPAPAPVVTAGQALPAEAPKRKRRTKAEMEAARAAPAADNAEPTDAEHAQVHAAASALRKEMAEDAPLSAEEVKDIVEQAKKALPPPVEPAEEALELFIDVYSKEAAPRLVDDLIAEISREAAKQAGVDDYGLIDFGKGPGFVRAVARQVPPKGRVMIRTSWGPAALACAEAWRPFAKRVFEAVR